MDPDVLFAVVDAKDKEQRGTYRSTDAGASWSRVSGYVTSYPFYCQKLFCDTVNVDRVYGMQRILVPVQYPPSGDCRVIPGREQF